MLGLTAAAAGLAKLGIGAKLASAVGMAKGLAGGAAAKQLAIPGLMGAAKGLGTAGGIKGAAVGGTRMAGNALGKLWQMSGRNTAERALRLGPDALFGTMAAVNTPGDFGDKLIAGGSQAIGSIGLGLAGSKLPGIRNTNWEAPVDMMGSVAGDFAGMYAGDAMLRAKGGGTTPWEKMQMEGTEKMRRELEQQIMAQYGLAGYRPTDLMG